MFVTVYVPNVLRGNSEQVSAYHKELHYSFICWSSFDSLLIVTIQIIEMYDGLIDDHLINKTNILAVMIVTYSIDSNYASPNHYQALPP